MQMEYMAKLHFFKTESISGNVRAEVD